MEVWSVSKVSNWLEANFRRFDVQRTGDLKDVHAGRLLTNLFEEQLLVYSKPQHELALTQWLLANKPCALAPITGLLTKLAQK